jgi:hypothetical protein
MLLPRAGLQFCTRQFVASVSGMGPGSAAPSGMTIRLGFLGTKYETVIVCPFFQILQSEESDFPNVVSVF